MKRGIGIGPLALTMLSLSWLACGDASREGESAAGASPAAAATAQLTDGRTAVMLPPELRSGVLAEMRAMLGAIEETLAALAEGERTAAAEAARGGGTSVAVDMDPALKGMLPAEFGKLGMSTHVAFDQLAAQIEGGTPADTLMKSMAALVARCNDCHSDYRLVTTEAATR